MREMHLRLVHPWRSIELLIVVGILVALAVGAVRGAFTVLSFFGTSFAWLVIGGTAGLVLLGAATWLTWAHLHGPGRTARHGDERGRGGRTMEVPTGDGTTLHVEVDGPDDAEVTVIFCHGWIVDLSTWHRQRENLQDSSVRRVFWDQRGHGRSGWVGLDRGERGVRQLAGDLAAVIAATAPTGRLVLVGHSMGGMTLMAFAQAHLPTVRARVDGVLLCATGAGPLDQQMSLGLPQWLALAHPIIRRYAVSTIALLGLLPLPIARLLGIGPWLLSTRLLACAPYALDDVVATTTGAMWRTRLHIAAVTLHAVMTHDERDAVPSLACTRTVTVLAGLDRLIPLEVQQELAAMAPGSRAVLAATSGHMVMLEAPDVVNTQVRELIARSSANAAEAADASASAGPSAAPDAEDGEVDQPADEAHDGTVGIEHPLVLLEG